MNGYFTYLAPMIDWLLQLDYNLFTWVNYSLSSNIGDVLMPLFREKLFWFPLYVAIIAIIIQHFKIRSYIVLLSLVLVVLCADQISSKVVKPWVKRTRPCNNELLQENIQIRSTCRQSFSFTSSHATNHFAVASFLFFLFGYMPLWKRILWFAWAGSVSIAQVYVGLHFPLDILGGCLLGIVIGSIIYRTLNYFYLSRSTEIE